MTQQTASQACPYCGQVPERHLYCGCDGMRQALRAAGRCEICGDVILGTGRYGRLPETCCTLHCRSTAASRRYLRRPQS